MTVAILHLQVIPLSLNKQRVMTSQKTGGRPTSLHSARTKILHSALARSRLLTSGRGTHELTMQHTTDDKLTKKIHLAGSDI